MQLAITGAAGFVGQAVVRRLREIGFDGSVKLIDQFAVEQSGFESVTADLQDRDALARAVEGADRVLHLVSLPGGAAQSDPALSRSINLEMALNLIDQMDGRRLVYSSSIAVFGDSFAGPIDDGTPTSPASVYGTHKRMVELAFTDAVRRGVVRGCALRLPGIVARPRSSAGFDSAFLSDLFHAVQAGEGLALPVSPDATSWLMSARICARNLIDALLSDFTEEWAVTLDAVRVRVGDLVEALAKRGGDTSGITYASDSMIQRVFGSHPALEAAHSRRLGLASDGSVEALVENVTLS